MRTSKKWVDPYKFPKSTFFEQQDNKIYAVKTHQRNKRGCANKRAQTALQWYSKTLVSTCHSAQEAAYFVIALNTVQKNRS